MRRRKRLEEPDELFTKQVGENCSLQKIKGLLNYRQPF